MNHSETFPLLARFWLGEWGPTDLYVLRRWVLEHPDVDRLLPEIDELLAEHA